MADKSSGDLAVFSVMYIEHTYRELLLREVFKIVFQRASYYWKGNFFPGNVCFIEKGDLFGFVARSEIEVGQFGTEKHVYLVDRWQIEKRIEAICPHDNFGTSFFPSFPYSAIETGFTVLHEAGWQCPLAKSRLDGALAK